jgi:formamidopyrimidine-DNA glycosylase
MPEGPEVKYLVDWLNKNLKNKKINKIIVHKGKYTKNGIYTKNSIYTKNGINISNIKLPLIIEKIKCKGKFIYWTFINSDIVMFNTLGMSGWWIFDEDKHNNIEFVLNDKSIYFNDFRNFGNITFSNKINLQKKLNTLGADILDTKNNIDIFKQRLEGKRNDTYIATALLDQKVACGCGNYLRAECLYIAKISPYRFIKDLTYTEIETIWNILRQLAWFYYDENKGIKLKIINNKYKLYNLYKKSGITNKKRDYGYFLIYRNDFDPYGNKITKENLQGRTIHYVKNVQT